MAFKIRPQQQKDAPGTSVMPAAPPAAQAPSPASSGPVQLSEDQLTRILAVVEQLPEATDSAYGDLLDKLLSADQFEDLNSPWAGTSGRELAGRRLLVTKVTRRPSTFEGGPAIFLVVESMDLLNGDKVTWTTSAIAVIVQLATCHARGWLPAACTVILADKPTAAGYTPYHLEVTAIRQQA